ncbi:unnamed protein product [Ceutorhynchus assimilis]|uniref:INO80 complex subunit B-like conserved region domain-containing protein n=1 Tax=Ceutorhynchus assimilis TaxID=467358 RepID=A0A9N9MPA8_9CUCU|nr:unnamed protein product [Ceutorhynchus assimilis]
MEQEESSPSAAKKAKLKKPSKPSPAAAAVLDASSPTSTNEYIMILDVGTPTTPTSVKNLIKPLPNVNKTSPIAGTSKDKSRRKKRDSASSDEERWLTAIESGKLEDVDEELKKIKPKDPALMTARQRAMYDRSGSDGNLPTATPTLMSLPTGYKEKVMTAEALHKAALKSQKRKQLADEKREKDKLKTMERLLKKQDSKATKQAKYRTTRTNDPLIIYKQNCFTTVLSLPEGIDFPLKPQKVHKPKKQSLCSMGCGNFKKYSCSKTGVPLCSLECYKKNNVRITNVK